MLDNTGRPGAQFFKSAKTKQNNKQKTGSGKNKTVENHTQIFFFYLRVPRGQVVLVISLPRMIAFLSCFKEVLLIK